MRPWYPTSSKAYTSELNHGEKNLNCTSLSKALFTHLLNLKKKLSKFVSFCGKRKPINKTELRDSRLVGRQKKGRLRTGFGTEKRMTGFVIWMSEAKQL